MARPNGSTVRAAATAQPHGTSNEADHAASHEPKLPHWPGFPPAPPPQQQAHADPALPPFEPGYPPYYEQASNVAPPAHGFAPYPDAGQTAFGHLDPYAQRSGTAQPPRAPSVAPQFEPFSVPEAAVNPAGYERFAPNGEASGGWPPPPAAYGYDQAHGGGHPLPPAYDAGQRQDPAFGDAYPQRGYEAAVPHGAPQAQWQQPYEWPPQGAESFASAGGYAPQQAPQVYGANQEPYADYQHGSYGQHAVDPGQGAYGQQPAEGDYAYEDAEADVPERTGPRPVVIVGALLGAIILGGGMAFGYKTFVGGGGSADGRPPVLRADSTPAKARPADPGGRTIAHTDKKFLNRLTEDRGTATGAPANPVPVSVLPPTSASSPREPEAEAGPRKVTTVVVNRDGSIDAPAAEPANTVPGVPGMLIDGLQPGPRPQLRGSAPAATPTPPAAAPDLRQSEPPPARRTREVAAIQPPAAAPAEPAPAAAPAARAPRRPATREAVAPPTTTAATGRGGYVAVLASRKSRMEALKAFADMQQKYGSVLQSATPDVREVNLGDKGVWYRAVVGPPGARSAATNVCGQLKTQGFSGCWVSAN